jgi:hypothetical protein
MRSHERYARALRRVGHGKQHGHRGQEPNSDFLRMNGQHASSIEPDNQKGPAHQPFTSGSAKGFQDFVTMDARNFEPFDRVAHRREAGLP